MALPWKSRVKHIGTTLDEKTILDQDIREKRGAFIDGCMNFAKPETRRKMFTTYNCHFTGSSAWCFDSYELERFYSSFNMNIKVMFDLPWPTHKWLCESLHNRQSPKCEGFCISYVYAFFCV